MYTPKLFDEGHLKEEDGHTVYYAQYGNPDGPAIVSLHGGPGSKSKSKHAARFDLDKYRLILIDQRGCGKSEYKDLLHENTMAKLISDTDRVREQLDIKKWFVAGGSWGSTMALLYAETYPDKVNALLLSAVYLADSNCMDWSFRTPEGVGMMFPDVWETRIGMLADLDITKGNIASGLLDALKGADELMVKKAAAVFASWEGNLLSDSEVNYVTPDEIEEDDIMSAKLFLHFETNGFFVEDNQILNQIGSIQAIPTVIVHGRYDVVCPYEQAWRLKNSMKNAQLITLPQSNHMFTADGYVAQKYIFDSFLKDLV